MKIAIIGHRKINTIAELEKNLYILIEDLILCNNADTFIFGGGSEFDDICYSVVTKMREKYTFIRRVYLRAQFEYIDESYESYLLSLYEQTEFPKCVHGAGAASYIKRNEAMIDDCDLLIVYFDKDVKYKSRRSGTALAVKYAERKGKPVINMFSCG